jgi:hypothetical protein
MAWSTADFLDLVFVILHPIISMKCPFVCVHIGYSTFDYKIGSMLNDLAQL